jgi:hypothetical protein
VVGFDNLVCNLAAAELLDVLLELVVKDIREPLEEHERQDKVFELGCVGRAANGAGGIPQPRF